MAALSDSNALQRNQDIRKRQQLVRLQDSVSKLSQQYADLSDSITRAEKSSQVTDTSANAVADPTVKQKDPDLKNQKELNRMKDSLSKMAQRYSNLTDSLAKATIEAQRRINDPVLIPEQRSAVAPARMQETYNQPNAKEYQRLQDKQDDLYRQYARQADVLSRDIDRLNSRMQDSRRDDRRRSNYIPVPIPVNNSGSNKREPVEVSITNVTDTIYIRDSIIVRDSIRITDTVKKFSPDTFVSRPIQEIPKPDTITIKEFVKQPGFDFESMPEENILFALGKKTVQPIYENKLDYIAGILKKNPGLNVKITGHTDASGSRAVNERLSLQRAEAVAGYLMNNGVSEKQIEIASESTANPAVSGNTAAAHSQNRRVALKLEKMDR